MSNTEEKNPFEGFKTLEGDTIAPDNIEIKDAPDNSEALVEDTGIVDKTDEPVEEEKKEEKKIDLTPELEIQYKAPEDDADDPEPEVEGETDIESIKENEEKAELSQIGIVAKFLKEEGIVDYEDESFEDSEEGLANVIQNEIKKGISKYKEDLDPTAQQFIEFVENGGDPSQFTKAYSEVDFNKIDPSKLKGQSEMQKQLVAELLRQQGYSREEITEEVQDLVDGGVLERKASRSLSKLQVLQNKKRAELLKSQEASAEKKKEEQATFLTSLKDDIENREEIAGFSLNKKSKKAFYDYITKADRKTGKTQLVLDSEADKDSQLKMAWLYFNNFDFSKVEKKIKTKAVSNLRSNLERASNVSTRKLKSKSRTKVSGDDLDFSLFSKAIR
tara:strand:+ start:10795 stop:11961 length:1167 start_codon:yes stop_codon:yes gene_type:complete